MTIHQISFSPTGGTRRVSELLCSGIEAKSILTELCVKEEELCLPSIAAGDLVVVSMPVYAGRVPALAVERLNAVESNGATCVIVAVYGNRAYEDALVEMQDVATAQGFNVVAAVAANAEHSICRMYGAGRPDAADAGELASFGRAILERVQGGKPFGRLAFIARQPPVQARLQRTFSCGKPRLYGMRCLREPMPDRCNICRQSKRQQQPALHRLYAVRVGLPVASEGHRRVSESAGSPP